MRFPGTVGAAPPVGAAAVRPRVAVQATLDDLGTPLAEVTFVVVDLETTGSAPQDSGITEIGAVKVRGGQVLGEFHTLVDPQAPLSPYVSLLTGITEEMLREAPPIGVVLPSFLEFARGAVLVAHNAPFDVGFLKAACAAAGTPWPDPPVVDTVRLARQLVGKDEARDRRLSTLAQLFGSSTVPDHRALHDARATVDVLHALIERVGTLGVHSLEELRSFSARVPEATRRKRGLADGLPSAPGVYLFHDARGRVLYVGTSVDIRTRVRSYFTASEQRSRMRQMVALATSVTPVVCVSALEARVRELRLIAEHSPAFNRRSRHPERACWVKLTDEPHPRLSVVRQVRDDAATYLGPFRRRGAAEDAVAALQEAFPLRQCGGRLPKVPGPDARSCALQEIGRCAAPCVVPPSEQGYQAVVEAARSAMVADPTPVVQAMLARAERLSRAEQFEEAATARDRMLTYVKAASRVQTLGVLARIRELVAAARTPAGGWELVLVRHGRLAGTTVTPPGAHPRPYVDALQAAGEQVAPACGPMPATHPEETEEIHRWLDRPGVRVVEVDGEWSCPVGGAVGARARLDPLGAARSASPFREVSFARVGTWTSRPGTGARAVPRPHHDRRGGRP
ncbi:MAG: DEDD exonuclease domain-containing protein [Kineosporiaceae bacterium]